MLKKPVLLTVPYLSPLFAPAIISLSSSSVMSSPKSAATFFSSWKLICPSLSKSNKSKAFSSSVAESFSLYTPTASLTTTCAYHLGDHDVQEFMEVDAPSAVFIEVANQSFDLFLCRLEPQSPQSHLELFSLDSAAAACVEQVESLLDLLLLLI